MQQLKKHERSILAQLELNARIPYTKLGKKIRQSQQRVSYAVQSLHKRDILQYLYTVVDYSKFDLLNFRVYFRVSYTKEKTYEDLVTFFVRHPYTLWVESCGGNYDLICTFFAPNPSYFNKMLRSIMEHYQRQLQNYTVLTTVVSRIFRRKFLNSKLQFPQLFVGGDREPVTIESQDLHILKEIATNARMSSVRLANKLGLTPKTIITRIKKLENEMIILGYRPLLHLKETGYFSRLLLIKYHNVTTETENKLISYMKAHPNVTSLVKTLGRWDIEIMIEIQNMADIRKTEREIRENFGSMIQEIQSIHLYGTHKLNYFPQFLSS